MYKLFTDGGSRGNPGNSACAYFLYENESVVFFDGKFLGQNTNNFAEYSGLLMGIEKIAKLKIEKDIEIYMDSELVVKQINGEYKINNVTIKEFCTKIHSILGKFKSYKINHILRAENSNADRLVNIILDQH